MNINGISVSSARPSYAVRTRVNEPALSDSQSSTHVTISQSKQPSSPSANTLPEAVRQLSAALHEDPNGASTAYFVEKFASTRDGELCAVGARPDSVVTYTATGEPLTDESKAYFSAMSENVLSERMALYNSELVKGTSRADIFDKIANYMAGLPERYLNMMNWGGVK